VLRRAGTASTLTDDKAMAPAKRKEQTKWPVMDLAIDKRYFTMYNGKKVYFCCPGCDAGFKKEPEKYPGKLLQLKEQKSD